MRFRTFLTFTFLGLVFASVILSLWSVWSWGSSWNALFTGAPLTSPMGCDCGVSINFWQHPYLYSSGLGATAFLVGLSSWVSVVMLRSWFKTRRVIRTYVKDTAPVEVTQLFESLRQEITPRFWPRVFLPRLVIIQEATPRAMSTGFFRPQVLISTATIDQVPADELSAILTHELMHLRSFDPVLLWCISALASILPLRQRVRTHSRIQEYIECKTDFEAGQRVGSTVLGRALLRVASWEQPETLAAVAQMPGAVEMRLRVLAGWTERPEVPWKSILGVGVWLSVLIFGTSLALQRVDQVYAQEVNSPACLEAESIVFIDNTLVLICPALPMSVE